MGREPQTKIENKTKNKSQAQSQKIKRVRVFITGHIPGEGIARLRKKYNSVDVYSGSKPISRLQLEKKIQNVDGLLCMVTDPIDKKVLSHAKKLKAISQCATGFDNIDITACNARGIIVSRTPGVLTESCADLAMALMLSVMRKVVIADSFLRSGQFFGLRPDLLLGTELKGKTLCVVGMGKIGSAVSRRAKAFGMNVVSVSQDHTKLKKLLNISDVVSIHCPLNSTTRHLFNDNLFSKMKKGSFLINTARGPIVDENALVRALQNGYLAGAGLDVYEYEPRVHRKLINMKNVVLLPHIASATLEARTRMADLAAMQLDAMLSGHFSRVERVPGSLIPSKES